MANNRRSHGNRDTSYLELHRGKWRVTLAVPRDLQDVPGLPSRFKRLLQTDSLAVANHLKWAVLDEFRAIIDRERRRIASPQDALTAEALEIAAARGTASPAELDGLAYVIEKRAEEIAGTNYNAEPWFNDADHHRRAQEYADVAFGRVTPIELHHEQYLSQSTVTAHTKADDKRAIKFLLAWCAQNGVRPTLQSVTRKRTARRFADALLAGAIEGASSHPATIKKYMSRLSRYWQWLEEREYVEFNPWAGIKIAKPPTPHDELARPFSEPEMLALLNGPRGATFKGWRFGAARLQALHDIMRIAALTGARLDPIVCLRVGDIVEAQGIMCFRFRPQKKEAAPRLVPVHSELMRIVKDRCCQPGDLFPEWPLVSPKRERSLKVSPAFTDYRRHVGVDQSIPGRRRSLVNFHSFRRWFVTQAERAGQPEHIIAAVVGHKRPGMTLGLYSAGPTLEQAQQCVQSVKLPRSG